MPTKEDLIHNPKKREELASKDLSMKAEAKDSVPYWFRERQNVIGAFRYLADPPSYRDQIPMELSLFTTRAVSYNHHPAIHSLYPDAEEMKAKSPNHYSKFSLANVLKIPLYVQWVGSFMAELDATIAAPIIQGSSIHWYRHEWGPNANPHTHNLHVIKSLNTQQHQWKHNILELANKDFTELSDNDIDCTKTNHTQDIRKEWDKYVAKYIKIMEQCIQIGIQV